MVSEIDIYRSASVLIKQYSERAELYALAYARRLSAKGDAAGAATWMRIAQAAKNILKREPNAGERRH